MPSAGRHGPTRRQRQLFAASPRPELSLLLASMRVRARAGAESEDTLRTALVRALPPRVAVTMITHSAPSFTIISWVIV